MEKMTTVPHFIKAKNEVELQKAMLRNNITNGYFYRYFDIRPLSKNEWVAWYFKNVEDNVILSGGMNESNDRR